MVKEVEDPEESSKKLVGEAIRRGSADNITCVVVRFLESKTANNNGSSSSSEEANQREIAIRKDSDHKNSAKETNQDHNTAVHRDLDRKAENKSLNQKPMADRSDSSSHITSNQKPIATTAAGRNVSSEHSGLAEEKNQMPIAISNSSEAKSSEAKSSAKKVPDQGQTTVDTDLDRGIAKKPVTATHTTSLEQSRSTGEKNRKPDEVHSDSAPSKGSSNPSVFN